jgi:hypothetical protein
MKKKGASHTEIILAFLMFIAAVGLALYFFSPGNGERVADTYLAYSMNEITQRTSAKVEVFSVKINGERITEDVIAVPFSGVNGNTQAATYDGSALPSYRTDNGFVHVSRGTNDWDDIDFITVSFSDAFDIGTQLSGKHNETYYQISTSRETEVLSEKKLRDLAAEYNSDYENLRKEFNLKAGFSFSLNYENGEEISAEKEVPTGLEVFSDVKRVEVLRESGKVEYADLMVSVW